MRRVRRRRSGSRTPPSLERPNGMITRWRVSVAFLVIATPRLSRLGGEKSSRLFRLQAALPRLLRQADSTDMRSLGGRLADLPGVRALARQLSEVRWRACRTSRLTGQEPTLHPALCAACGQAVPRHAEQGGGRNGASAPWHGEGSR